MKKLALPQATRRLPRTDRTIEVVMRGALIIAAAALSSVSHTGVDIPERCSFPYGVYVVVHMCGATEA
jgi:hypothetical protein